MRMLDWRSVKASTASTGTVVSVRMAVVFVEALWRWLGRMMVLAPGAKGVSPVDAEAGGGAGGCCSCLAVAERLVVVEATAITKMMRPLPLLVVLWLFVTMSAA